MNKFNFLLNVRKYWQYFVTWMISGSDLQVWPESDRCGNISCWHAYDPITGRSACFGSEEEMRIWIDKCYYR
ncbi:hypothetical protein [Nostoc sp.]|uniref:hypothetical protein n=1 Tax=Nostoc sp. TaxID=1180 RepID=UPI002FF59FEE